MMLAAKEEAAYRRVFTTLRVTLPVTIALSTANWLLSPYTLRLFTNNENVIHLGYFIMMVDIIIEIGRCLNMTFVSSLKAAGDYLFPLIVGLLTMWGFGVAGVYFGTATDEFLRGLIVMRRWRKKRWLGKAVVQKENDPVAAWH